MNNNLSKKEGQSIALMDDNKIKQFQSLYYLIKGKRDTDIKLFTENKQFCYDDIIELNNKILNKLHLHELLTNIVTATVGLENKEIKSFGSWNEFKNTDWNISARTKYIALEWDFNIFLPNSTHKIPQTHTLRIRIGNNLKPSEMIQVVFQGGDDYELEEAQAQMSCKIDFVNSQICNELKNIVSEWYDSLQKNSEDHRLIKFILRHEVKLQNLINLSFITAAIILVNYLFSTLMYSQISFLPDKTEHKLFLALTSSIAIFYIFARAGTLYADKMLNRQIEKLKRNPIFDFTKGDRNRFTEVKKENKELIRKIITSLIMGLLVNGITTFIGLLIKLIVE